MKSRTIGYLVFFALTLLIAEVFYFAGASAWRIWNIPTLQPSFVDARILTASAESYRLGFDPESNNPRDPYRRLFNLPALWKVLFLTPLKQSETAAIAGFCIACYWVSVLIFLSRIELTSFWVVTLAGFTPPAMLAIERGNVDLLIFFSCIMVLLASEVSGASTSLLLILASALKLYPIFGIVTLFKFDRRSFVRFSFFALITSGIIFAFDIPNLRHVFENTEVGSDLSFGSGVLPLYVQAVSGSHQLYLLAGLLANLVIFSIFLAGLFFAGRVNANVPVSNPFQLSAFRLGAGIYVGTFILSSNWDYRLIFLIFTLPQLVEWMKKNPVAKFTLYFVLLSLVYLWVTLVSPLAYLLDEFSNWIVFAGMLYLLMISLPDWAKEELAAFSRKYRRQSV